MIKINWAQIKDLKALLLRKGLTQDTDILVMIFYRNTVESEHIKIKLSKIGNILFAAESNRNVVSVFVFDADAKKPLWRVKEDGSSTSKERIPVTGHSTVIRDFDGMSPEQKDVWVEMTYASLMQHLAMNEV